MTHSQATSPVALVTGGSRGIGRAVAVALARQGWDICFNYLRDAQSAEATVSAVSACGQRAVAVQADVASHDDVRRLFSVDSRRTGRINS